MKHWSVNWKIKSPATYASSMFNDSKDIVKQTRNFSSLERAVEFKEELDKAATILKIQYNFEVVVNEVEVED